MTTPILKDVDEAKNKSGKAQRFWWLAGMGSALVYGAGAMISISPVATAGLVTYCAARAAVEFVERKGRRDVMLEQRKIAEQFGTSHDVDVINRALDSEAKHNTVRNKMFGAFVSIPAAIVTSVHLAAPEASSGVFIGSVVVGMFAGFLASRAVEKKAESEIRFFGVQPILAENIVASILKERGLQDGVGSGATSTVRTKMK